MQRRAPGPQLLALPAEVLGLIVRDAPDARLVCKQLCQVYDARCQSLNYQGKKGDTFAVAGLLSKLPNLRSLKGTFFETINIGEALQPVAAQLTDLDLDCRGGDLRCFEACTNLHALVMTGVGMHASGLVPVAAMTQLTSFRFLPRIDALTMNNALDVAPLTKLSRLQRLELSVSGLFARYPVIDPRPLTNLKSLTSLNLGFLGLKDATISWLSALPKLKHVTLSAAQFVEVAQDFHAPEPRSLLGIHALEGLTELNELRLLCANFDSLAVLVPLKALTHLQLSNSSIEVPESLRCLTCLRELSLQVSSIPLLPFLPALTQLSKLHLSNSRLPFPELQCVSLLTALQLLDLQDAQLDSAQPLSTLTALRTLNLSGTRVQELDSLSGLALLQMLDISSTPLADGGPLSALTSLRELCMSNTEVSDISALAHLTVLTRINFSFTPVADLSPLSGLTALVGLEMWKTEVASFEPLAQLTGLQYLNAGYTAVTDVQRLSGLAHLTELLLNRAEVTDISPLASLTALRSLSLTGTKVSSIADIVGLPKLGILFIPPSCTASAEVLKGHCVLHVG